MRRYLLTLACCAGFCINLCAAQSLVSAPSDTTYVLSGVMITGIHAGTSRATSLHIESHLLTELQAGAPYNLSDALAAIPGISQIATGNAISKPVLRGLFGNRVLVLLSGLRFDNQQFQDEHGLGLSQIGIDRVELIRGPASLLYGTDAVGGVINVIEETPPATQTGMRADATLRLYSNTLGTLTDVGLSKRQRGNWWRLRGGYESHGDYSDGAGTRVYDSRNTGYYFKTGYGFRRAHWESNNSYNGSFNQYGFILDSLNRTAKQDARWSRDMAEPHHNVLLNILSSQNTFYLHRSSEVSDTASTVGSLLKLNAGLQSNRRAEDEGGGEISLNMHLLSLLQSARWEKYLSPKTLLVVNQQATYEKNTNYGKRIIIPDAHLLEGNVSAFVRHQAGKLIVESGLGTTYKQITTLRTGRLNAPGKANQPFSVARPAINGMAGFSYNPSAAVNVKTNIATGVRTGNLAELASEGLHEGSFRYEIGNPGLKAEQNVNADLTIEVSRPKYFLSLSGFYNHFSNYIFLRPTNDSASGIFQIFRYVQQDANLRGGEAIAIYKPIKGLQIKGTFSIVEGRLDSGGYLPFIPAAHAVGSVRYERDLSPVFRSFYAGPSVEYRAAQTQPAQFETATPAYTLVHFDVGFSPYFYRRAYTCGVSVRNVFNRVYADHLSRLRYYGINNEGLNIVLTIGTRLGS